MSGEIVVDASVLLRARLATQEGHEEAAATLRRLLDSGWEPVAPDLIAYELGQALRRSPSPAVDRERDLLDILRLVRAIRPPRETHTQALRFAEASRTSFYDASYVALARTLQAPLWTEDQEILRKAPDVAIDTRRAAAAKRY